MENAKTDNWLMLNQKADMLLKK
jgi:serine/threonine protein kinase